MSESDKEVGSIATSTRAYRLLLCRMMCHEQATRLSIDEVLGDPWLFQTLLPPVVPFDPFDPAPVS